MVSGGRQENRRTVASTMIRPSQKLGIAIAAVTARRETLSSQEFRRRALNSPIGTPISHEIITAIMAICAEIGPRRNTCSRSGSLVQNEYPRSPRATSCIQDRYC